MTLNSKGILQEFDLVIYPVSLVVAIGDMEKEINAKYKPYEEEYNYLSHTDNPAATYHIRDKKTNDCACMVWFPKIEEVLVSYMAHEAGHVAMEIFKYIGARVNYDDQEPFCYLLGTVTRLTNKSYYTLKEYLDKQKEKK